MESVCEATCEQVQSGNTVFLDGSTTGNITFNQTCAANAQCAINNEIDNLITLTQGLLQGNTTSASLFPNFGSVNSNNASQSISNQVKNIISNSCTANVDQVQANNLVYARNSTTGDIAFTQNGNANANCIMNNIARAKVNLNQEASQSNTVGLAFGGIIGLIILIIIVVVIISALRKGGGGGGSSGGGGGGGGNYNNGGNNGGNYNNNNSNNNGGGGGYVSGSNSSSSSASTKT